MFLQYDTKEKNTTVGMPELKPVVEDPKLNSAKVKTFADDDCGDSSSDPDVPHHLTDDVYAFIAVAPIASRSFIFAFYVIMVKYVAYGILASGIEATELYTSSKTVEMVKFFLIPVAIAMQEDLIHVYASAANIVYDEEVLKISTSATKCKLVVGFLLRFIDGLASLGVNFAVMLTTDTVLSVFLNFAALHFLQSIDDVFFILVEKGFFGDEMEHMSKVCKTISFPRRSAQTGCGRELDSILFVVTLAICYTIYGVVVSRVFEDLAE